MFPRLPLGHGWRRLLPVAAGVWHLPSSVGVVLGREPSQADVGVVRPGRGFRGLALVTVLSVFTLVTLGGVVRLTGSGLGCPDWPLCHGKVIPPLDGHTLIEYSHRLMASVVGALVLATAFVVWRSYRRVPWLLVPASLGLLLLVVQVLLGGVTVLKELPPAIVLAHLAVAEALMVCMVVVCMEALRGPGPVRAPADLSWRRGAFPFLALAALLGAYVILLTGSYVATSGWATACGQSWPLCQGQLIPDGYGATMHMVHRGTGVGGGGADSDGAGDGVAAQV